MASETGYSSPSKAIIRPGALGDLDDINRLLLVLDENPSLNTPTTFVAEIGGRVQGCASVYVGITFGWLANVVIDRPLRRSGIGTRLVEACVERALDRRLPDIWLETMFWNRRFYEKLGFNFVPIREVPGLVRSRRRNPKCLMMRADLRARLHTKTPPAAMQPRASVVVEAL